MDNATRKSYGNYIGKKESTLDQWQIHGMVERQYDKGINTRSKR